MRTIKIKADTYRQDYNYRECKQNDDIPLEVTLLEGGVELDLSGYTITLNWVKSDSTVVTIAGDTIKVIGNIVSLILPRDCTRSVGKAKFELVITDNTSKQISTFPLSLEIIGSVVQGQQASNNVATLTEELNNANIAAINTKNELKDVIETADLTTYASKGQMQEVNEQLEEIETQVPSNKSLLEKFSTVDSDLYFEGEKMSPTNYDYLKYPAINNISGTICDNTANFSPILVASSSSVNSEITFTVSGKYGAMRYTGFSLVTGHKYYTGMKIKAGSNLVGYQVYKTADNNYFVNKKHSGSGNYETLSYIHTATADALGLKIIDERASGFDAITFKEIIFVDLTALYGVGKEPSASDFENILFKNNILTFYFKGTTTLVNAVEYPKTNTLFPIFVDKTGDVINVISKYSDTKDIRYEMKKKGVNNIFDFANFYLINNNMQSVSNVLGGTIFHQNGTDFFSPYKIKAINNIDGDTPTVDHFTGGNHGYNGDATGSSTGRTTLIDLRVDGRKVPDFSGYCNFIDIVWTNYIQAMNTKKASGTGREVIKESIHLHFDGYKWEVRNTIELLEDCNITTHYGLQCSNTAWNEGIFYHSSSNRKWNSSSVQSNNGNKNCNIVTLKKGIDRLDISIDNRVGLGRLENLLYVTYNCFSESYGKTYFFLVYGGNNFSIGDVLSFEGYYRFYSR